MPELPEVETIRRGLSANILGKKINRVQIKKSNLVRNTDRLFTTVLQNNSFSKIDRIGKLLIFELKKGDKLLLVHLKMTGQLIYSSTDDLLAGGHNWPPVSENLPNKFSHVIFSFSDDSRLFYNDLRQFGYLQLIKKKDRRLIEAKFGIEPGQKNFTWNNFRKIFIDRKTPLKALLLNQKLIAGLGNIYVDEICFRAGLRPDRNADKLKEKELKKIFKATDYIIKKAIAKKGTTFSDYRDVENKKGNFSFYLKVYGRKGEQCFSCQGKIEKIKLAGRGTHFCLNCQK
ncbi:MAG: bifunctional DNA-formamidopyrimidine glycosylase/DNA-(apurinic or apyrimidinic site) lyase [Patescibacteria group bacterium]|nr:bifunctional DNA-formamidopyrimidine glycosylase/DNA-(apurinic or apyrimidinic site) lyase [Patescibacteria group bacterium]